MDTPNRDEGWLTLQCELVNEYARMRNRNPEDVCAFWVSKYAAKFRAILDSGVSDPLEVERKLYQ